MVSSLREKGGGACCPCYRNIIIRDYLALARLTSPINGNVSAYYMCARVYVHEVRRGAGRAWTTPTLTTYYAPRARACIMYHASHRRTVNVQPTRGCRRRARGQWPLRQRRRGQRPFAVNLERSNVTSDISSLDVGIR